MNFNKNTEELYSKKSKRRSQPNIPIQPLLSLKFVPLDERTLEAYWDSLYFAFIFLGKGRSKTRYVS